ncbi:hypothetical protein [Deinococcus psychrotolerans]|nr:hypothetical protein [Deinococcus psychrotolerans]
MISPRSGVPLRDQVREERESPAALMLMVGLLPLLLLGGWLSQFV